MVSESRECKVQRAFISLLKIGLWNSVIDTFDIFILSSSEWLVLYQVAIAQTVEGLVFDAITKLPGQYQPPKMLALKWAVRIDAVERENLKKEKIIAEIAGLLKAHHIDVTLLKGSSLAVHYAKPLLRLSGDVDFYFENSDAFKKANQLIKQKGIKIKYGALNSTYYSWKGCEIEHHSKLIDIVNPFQKRYLKKMERQEADRKTPVILDGMKINSPSVLMTHIQVNAHILKHFLGFGIGLRQFCDVARLYFNTSHSLECDQLKFAYKKLGIYNWMELTHSFLVHQLGLNPEFLPYQIQQCEDNQWLMNDVLNAGNFGFYSGQFSSAPQTHQERKHTMTWGLFPRFLKAQRYAHSEALWFPFSRIWSTLLRRRKI